ncbi:MAG: NAD(P)/FAD-dependent oxidoreductase [Gammaproteobacteria bacterium]|nr:MAG: NAD(P)/FAD-dependent oxidoreductase [Gammaproteobacteria bacterium]
MTDNHFDNQYQTIIVGGGHNGLVCATYLAKSGRKVLLLEANEHLGGGAVTNEFHPGFSVSACAQWLMQLSPDIIKDLALEQHGLRYAARDLCTIALDEKGNNLVINGDSIHREGISDKDKSAYKKFHKQSLKFAKLLSGAAKRRPPKLVEGNLTDRLTLLKLGIDMKLLGKDDMRDLMRIALINMFDVMEENFDDELLKAALALDGVLGSHMGPRSPNTVFGYLYRRLGDVFGFKGPAILKGGMGTLGNALASSAKTAGVTIKTNCKVKNITISQGQATGVLLETGETISAETVVSNADPKTTFEKLVGYRNIETGVARHVHNIRMQGNTAKLHLALKGQPAFNGVADKDLGNRLLIAPTMNYIERAFNHAKYGEFSKAPALDISIPTIHDKSLAPEGQHLMSTIVQFAPYQLKNGWDQQARDTFEQLIIDQITLYAPAIKEQIIGSELLLPEDLEQRFNMHGGHWHHGELSLDQIMMMRPFPGATQYGTAVDGLFFCGAGSHPGGGLMGLAGRNAAKEIIKRGNKA